MHCLGRIFLVAACLLAAGTSRAAPCEESASADTVSIGLEARGAAVSLDVACHFPSGSGTYTATSPKPNVVTAGMGTGTSASILTLTPGMLGDTTHVKVSRGSATLTVLVDVAGGCVMLSSPIPADTLKVNGTNETVDLSMHFVKGRGDALVYTATSSATSVVAVSVSEDDLTLDPGSSPGDAEVTIAVKNDCGGIQTVFGVRVKGPPVLVRALPDTTLAVSETVYVYLPDYFREPDGDNVRYNMFPWRNEDLEYVGLSMAGAHRDSLRIVGKQAHTSSRPYALIDVTARDEEGAAEDRMRVVVTANPVVSSAIVDTTLASHGYTSTYTLSEHFTDPAGQALTFTATSSATDTATAAIASGVLTVTSGAVDRAGKATIEVVATDTDDLSASDAFVVTVSPNRAPAVDKAIRDTTLTPGGTTATYTLHKHFTDPDGDDADLRYAAPTSTAEGVATARVNGGVLTVTTVAAGTATISVTATDPGNLSVTDAFVVTVAARCVITVDPPIAGATLATGGATHTVTLSEHFSHSHCADVTYGAPTTTNAAVATATIASGVLTVTSGSAAGTARITVVATDTGGTTKSASFDVTVTSGCVITVNPPIAGATLATGGATHTVTLSEHFSHSNCTNVTYGAPTTTNAAVATATIASGVLTVTSGSTAGTARITVVATGSGGTTQSASFDVTVTSGCAITVDSPIADTTLASNGYAATYTLSEHFSGSCAVTYGTPTTTNAAVATATIAGGVLTVTTGGTTGTATITVPASATGARPESDAFVVTVTQNVAPRIKLAMGSRTLNAGGATADLTLSEHFEDPDGKADHLRYGTPTTTAEGVATGSIAGGILTVTSGTSGSATISIAATDPGGLSVTGTVAVTISRIVNPDPNEDPVPVGRIADRVYAVNGAPETFDVSGYFRDPNGDRLTYSATTTSVDEGGEGATENIVTVRMVGSRLTVTPAARGKRKVIVTADDNGGGTPAEQPFTATVNAPPICSAVLAQTLDVEDDPVVVSVSCTDADGHSLTYTLADLPADPPATVTLSGSTVTITAVAVGSMTATVTADDGHGGTAGVPIGITVENIAPRKTGTMGNASLTVGGTRDVDVSGNFTDPEGEALTYAASSGNPGAVTTSVNGSTVTLRGVSAGTATITVTASDRHGGVSAAHTFTATVAPNRAPVKVGTIPNRTLQVGGSAEEFDVSGYFRDPESHAMTYASGSSATGVATASQGQGDANATLTLTPKGAGDATISVVATDEHDAASMAQEFTVTVCGTPAGSAIPAQQVLLDGTATIALVDYFTDPNGGDLTYATSRTGVLVSLAVSEDDVLTVTPEVVGSATVSVTATNECGNTSAAQSFGVTVRGKPVAMGSIPGQKLTVGGSAKTLDVSPYFSEPDGDTVTYSARVVSSLVRIPDYVSLSFSNSTLTMTPGTTATGASGITVEVTATDSDGSATQTFTLNVAGGN